MPLRLLIADDSATNRLLFSTTITRMGHQADVVATGREAIDLFLQNRYDLVFLDINMPVMGGIATAKEIQSLNKSHTPVYAISGWIDADIADQMLLSGVRDIYRTLNTTHRGETLMTAQTTTAATPQNTTQATQRQSLQSSGYALIDTCKFKLRTVEEARSLANFATGMFKDPARIEPGLYELLLNAVEHGCLEIGHGLKSRLLHHGTLEMEIARRQSLPQNREKNVEVVIARRSEGIFVVITDPGPGFDWKSCITVDPARAGDSHGRGIARARGLSFDSIAFNAEGNQVAAHTRDLPEQKW